MHVGTKPLQNTLQRYTFKITIVCLRSKSVKVTHKIRRPWQHQHITTNVIVFYATRNSHGLRFVVFCCNLSQLTLPMSNETLLWFHNGRNGVSNHQPHHCLLNRIFRRRSNKTSRLCVTGLCEGNSPVNGEFPARRASNAENVSIWWRHDGIIAFQNIFVQQLVQVDINENTKTPQYMIFATEIQRWRRIPYTVRQAQVELFNYQKKKAKIRFTILPNNCYIFDRYSF